MQVQYEIHSYTTRMIDLAANSAADQYVLAITGYCDIVQGIWYRYLAVR